jgi:hypothetical protein
MSETSSLSALCQFEKTDVGATLMGSTIRVDLVVGNSYIFQQISALVSQYQSHFVKAHSPAIPDYYSTFSSVQRCECVWDNSTKEACIERFSLRQWENPDGEVKAVDFSKGDGFYKGMQGPPLTMSVSRFDDGTEMYTATNHPLMNTKVFGLEALAKAFDIKLSEFDAIYMNYGNVRGFGRMFCGGVGPSSVAVGEFDDEHVTQSLLRGGFRGKLLLTSRLSEEDVKVEFASMLRASASGAVPWSVVLVPLHMNLNLKMGAFLAGNPVPSCATQPGCPRQTLKDPKQQMIGHACEPGFADVSVNMFLHALRSDSSAYNR